MHPTTDIICLVHNRIEVTKVFVDKLFQNTNNFNLLFVDNASEDGTHDFLKKGQSEGKWKFIRHEVNTGVIEGRNSGANLVSRDYFLNIDNDQFVGPGWLQGLHNMMKQGFDIVGKEAWRLHPPGKGGSVIFHGNPVSMDYFPIRKCTKPSESFTYIGCGGMLIKKKVYDDIGLFDNRFSPAYFEDPDLCFRAIKAGYKLGWYPRCPIEHLGHQTIGTQSLFSKNDQFLQSWNKFKDKWNPYFPPQQRVTNASI